MSETADSRDFLALSNDLGKCAEDCAQQLSVMVKGIMEKHGEDPSNLAMLTLRTQQAAYSVFSIADRNYTRACRS